MNDNSAVKHKKEINPTLDLDIKLMRRRSTRF